MMKTTHRKIHASSAEAPGPLGPGESSHGVVTEGLEGAKAVLKHAAAAEPVSKLAPVVTKSAAVETGSSFELPETASAATIHFHEQHVKRAEKIEETTSQTREKEPIKPLPVDHFSKQSEPEAAARADEPRKLAEEEIPMGIRYFTAKVKEDKAKALAELRALGEADVSAPTRHSRRLAEEKETSSKPGGESGVTQNEREKGREFEKAEHEPHEPSFAELETKKAVGVDADGTQSLQNDPVELLSIDHFTKQSEAQATARAKEGQRLAESQVPIGIRYFTAKAREDKAQALAERRALSEANMSVATRYFKRLAEETEARKAAEIESTRDRALHKDPVETLPIDFFTKQNEARAAGRAKEHQELAKSEIPIGVKYFTAKAKEDKAKALAKQRALSEANMSVATRYFKRLAEEKEVSNKSGGESGVMPAAIQYFTLKDRAKKENKRRALEKAKNEPHEPSVATKYFSELEAKKAAEIEAARARAWQKDPIKPLPINYFTKQNQARAAAKAKEARELADSQIPIGIKYFTAKAKKDKAKALAERKALCEANMSFATRHFKRLAEEKEASNKSQGESTVMPAAIQYFTLKDRAKKEKKRLSLEKAKNEPREPSVATKYFAELEAKKAAEIEAARARAWQKDPIKPLPIDYFTKQNQARAAAKAKEARELAVSQIPIGIKYFTAKAKEDKAKALAERKALCEANMSVATRHFKRLAEEKQANNKPGGESKVMPAAIQYFTLKDRAKKEKKRLSLEKAKNKPHELSVATKYFAELEAKKAAEIEAARARAWQKDPIEPLPIDYFSKQNEARTAVKAKEARELAESQIPIGIKYFTAKAKEDKAKALAERRSSSEANMSVATRHFKCLAEEKQASTKPGGESKVMPAAIQYFTLKDQAKKEKRRCTLEKAKNERREPSVATKYFAELETKKAGSTRSWARQNDHVESLLIDNSAHMVKDDHMAHLLRALCSMFST